MVTPESAFSNTQSIQSTLFNNKSRQICRGSGAGGARGAMAPPIFWGKTYIDFRQGRGLHERLQKILKIYVYAIRYVVVDLL